MRGKEGTEERKGKGRERKRREGCRPQLVGIYLDSGGGEGREKGKERSLGLGAQALLFPLFLLRYDYDTTTTKN